MAINQQTLALQKQLLAAGFNPGPLDGMMGPKTKAALAQFNQAKAAQPVAPPAAPQAPAPPATPAAVPPAPVDNVNTLYSDPAFLAFQRASGQGLEISAADVARKQAAIQTALQGSISGLQQQREQSMTNVDNSAEARGVFKAGARMAKRQAESDNYDTQIGNAQTGTATQIADLNADLAGKVAAQQQKAAELGFSTAQTQALDSDYETLRKKYPAQFAGK